MALALNWTTDSGLSVPNSYWTLAQITFSPIDKTGSLLWYGYTSQADQAAGMPPIGQVGFDISPATWAAFIGSTGALTPTLREALEQYAMSSLSNMSKAFFSAATQV